jgi:L-rhamnono-1,4-lactonase
MGEHGFSFDLGVDMRSGGAWQLTEAIEMIKRVNENVHPTQRVPIVISK